MGTLCNNMGCSKAKSMTVDIDGMMQLEYRDGAVNLEECRKIQRVGLGEESVGMMRGSLGCSSMAKSEVRNNTGMVQLMDGDGATNPAEDIGMESMRRGNLWERGFVGEGWDYESTNTVSNFTLTTIGIASQFCTELGPGQPQLD